MVLIRGYLRYMKRVVEEVYRPNRLILAAPRGDIGQEDGGGYCSEVLLRDLAVD